MRTTIRRSPMGRRAQIRMTLTLNMTKEKKRTSIRRQKATKQREHEARTRERKL